jgi:RNA polymerase-associated protein LEO1
MVRWSDGSVSLQLGSDLFDVAPSYGTTLARPTDPQPKASAANDKPAPSSTFLVVSAKEEEVLMTERAVAGQLSIVPTSMTSKTHLELAKHVGQQHAKASKMKILGDDIRDPEQINKLLRQAAGTNPVKVSRTRSKTERKTSSSRRKRGAWSSDEEGYESDEPRAGRKVERDAGEYDEDDGFVVADDDDEEEEEKENSDDAAYGSKRKSGNKKKSKRRKSESLDEMEEAERRIEAAERERKRAKKDKGGGSGSKSRDYVDTDEEDAEGEPDLDEDMEMDVESEED